MKRKQMVTIVVISGVLTVAALTAWTVLQPSQQAAAPESPASSGAESGQEVTITYTDSGFVPKEISAKKGDTLRVVNESSADLEFSSDDHPVHTDNPELNMSRLQKGEAGMLALTKAGNWGIHNHLKEEDTALITVSE